MKLTKSKLKEMVSEEIKSLNEKSVKRGSKITYTKQFKFGKEGKETSKVVAIRGDIVLLDNGDELRLTQIKLKPKNYKIESVNEAQQEIGGYYLMKQLKDLAHDAKRSGEGKLNKALMYLHSRINQSYRDVDLNVRDIQDIFNDPRGRKYSKDIPTWMIDDLFEGKINETGMFSDYHELNRAYMDKFIKNYKKLNSKNLVKKKGGDVYGFRKGEREAHWKYDDNFRLNYDIDKAKVLGLINFFNRAKQNHPWG